MSSNNLSTRENSLSAFVTGVAFGAVTALLVGTKKGRDLLNSLLENTQDIPQLLKDHLHSSSTTSTQPSTPQKQVLTKLKRKPQPTNTKSFTQNGQPLKD